jgi:hypothetical protein
MSKYFLFFPKTINTSAHRYTMTLCDIFIATAKPISRNFAVSPVDQPEIPRLVQTYVIWLSVVLRSAIARGKQNTVQSTAKASLLLKNSLNSPRNWISALSMSHKLHLRIPTTNPVLPHFLTSQTVDYLISFTFLSPTSLCATLKVIPSFKESVIMKKEPQRI